MQVKVCLGNCSLTFSSKLKECFLTRLFQRAPFCWWDHGSPSQSINRPHFWRRRCRNSIVLLKQLLNKWPRCATCRTGRRTCARGPRPRSPHARQGPDLSENAWPPSEPALDKLSASEWYKEKTLKLSILLFLSSLFAHQGGFSWQINPISEEFVFKNPAANRNIWLNGQKL